MIAAKIEKEKAKLAERMEKEMARIKSRQPKDDERSFITELKATALEIPLSLPTRTWNIITQEVARERSTSTLQLGDITKEAASRYKNLSPEQKEVWRDSR